MRLLANRLTQSVSDRPAPLKTITDAGRWYPCKFCPFYHQQAPPIPCQNAVVSCISHLLFFAGPPAVFWTVALRVVCTIQRVLRGGTFAHVLEKRLERIPPLRVDRNPATTVVAVGRFFAVVAALNHTSPSRILSAFMHSVFGVAKPKPFFVETAAASGVSAAQIFHSNRHSISADTAAQPKIAFEFYSDWFERSQLFKFLIGDISKRRHVGIMYQKLGKARV